MAHIYRQDDGRWRAQVFRHGTRASKVCETKHEAQRWSRDKELELDSLKGSKGRTFGAAVRHYLKTVSPDKVNAVEWERRRFADMALFFGEDTPLAKIDSDRVGEWRDWRLRGDKEANRKPVKGETVLREANLLRNLFKLAEGEWKWIAHYPFKGVRMPDGSDDRELVWGWREIRLVYRHLSTGGPKQQELAWAFMTALRTCMRLNEVLAAKLSGNIALLPREKTSKAKVTKPVKVPLTRHGIRWMKRKPEITLGANEASTLFSDATLDLGIRVKGEEGLTFHDTRATALTRLSRKVDVLTLSRISRHRDINVLQRKYYRETAEQIAARL